MPYTALQLVGMGALIKVLGLTGELPLIAAFELLAHYTHSAGLRPPALLPRRAAGFFGGSFIAYMERLKPLHIIVTGGASYARLCLPAGSAGQRRGGAGCQRRAAFDRGRGTAFRVTPDRPGIKRACFLVPALD